MMLPFTVEEFFEVFRDYNIAVWPLQLFWNALALACIFLIVTRPRTAGRFVSLSLAALWLWMAVVYHFFYFIRINPAAGLFGALFLIQAFLFYHFAVAHDPLDFKTVRSVDGVTGLILSVYSLVGYPLFNWACGHHFPGVPTFGVPCPTTIFTFSVLCLARNPGRRVLVIPLLWTIVGSSAALLLKVPADFGLPAAGLMMLVVRARDVFYTKTRLV